MTLDEFRAAFHKRFAHVPPSRRTAALDNMIANDAQNTVKVWELPDPWWLENAIDKVKATNPKLFEPAPTVTQLLTLRAQEYEAKMGTPFSPAQRLAAHRQLEALDGDARVAELGDRELPKVEEQSVIPPTPADRTSVEALDAEVARRWGKTWPNMSAVERRKYHSILLNEQRIGVEKNLHNEAALSRVDGDTSKLSPTQRLSAFRSEQAVKATNGA